MGLRVRRPPILLIVGVMDGDHLMRGPRLRLPTGLLVLSGSILFSHHAFLITHLKEFIYRAHDFRGSLV